MRGYFRWAGLGLLALAGCGSNKGDTYIIVSSGGSSSGGSSQSDGGTAQTGGSKSGSGGADDGGEPGSGGSSDSGGTNTAGGSAGAGGGESCQTTWVGVSGPADFIVVVDNSGSMAEEVGAIETAITTAFAAMLESSGLDYQVILISRHRTEARELTETARTSVCVGPPLSSLASCPAEIPGPSTRFKHYSEKVESYDVLDWILAAYDTAPGFDAYAALAPNGYGEWLRPNAHKAFIVLTDDDESNDDTLNPLTASAFVTELTTLSPTHFGTPQSPTFSFHSIVGLGEKPNPATPYLPDEPIQMAQCTGNGGVVESYAPTYQELSIMTGGLRFPLCQYPAYATMLDGVIADAAMHGNAPCDFAIPPGVTSIDPGSLIVSYLATDGGESMLTHVATLEECGTGGYYVSGDRIYLCPATCDQRRSEPLAKIRAVHPCQ